MLSDLHESTVHMIYHACTSVSIVVTTFLIYLAKSNIKSWQGNYNP